MDDDIRYKREVLGVKPEQTAQNKPETAQHHTIVLQIPSWAKLRQKLKRFFKQHRKPFRNLVLSGVSIALLFGFWTGFRWLAGRNQADKGANDITPAKVYVPKNVPEGFSVGSGSQSLENGATLYTIYDNEGHEITVTQQAKPGDMDLSFFESAQTFDTSLGTGYIIQEPSRITGYILTDKTLILFNSTEAVASSKLRELMQTFQP